MTKRTTAPEGAITVTTYAGLDEMIGAFAAGHINMLMLVGPPGVGKSQVVRRAVGAAAGWVAGQATAYALYAKAFRCRDRPLVIDDVDGLYSQAAAVRLLKCLAQTDEVKHVGWHSASASMQAEGVPQEFQTRSRLVIIANDWRTLNDNVAAVQDRGHVVVFSPTAEEVHRRARPWFDDDEVYDWFGRHLKLIARPSFRHYVRAKELKAAGLDWVRMIGGQFLPPKLLLVAEIKDDPKFSSEAERVAEFKRRGGGSRATYFNHAKKLRVA